MGSEMCIRDRRTIGAFGPTGYLSHSWRLSDRPYTRSGAPAGDDSCLLYTSDAADERSSVDLGGRRTIKKKNMQNISRMVLLSNTITQQSQISRIYGNEI